MRGPARRPGLLLLVVFLVASCGPGRASSTGPAGAVPASVPTPAAVEVGADVLTPLSDGPAAFATIRAVLTQAKRSIDLEIYEFQREDLAALILKAHHRGVAVTAIMDPSEQSSRATWLELDQGGVHAIAFPVESQSIDHVKLLIVDRQRAVVGGINWGRHSQLNHDYDVLVSGPVVANLERVFQEDLALAGRPAIVPSPQPDSLVRVLVTRPGKDIQSSVLDAIGTARRTIDVEMFVLSDHLVIDALSVAARRGVAVRVLLEESQPQNGQTISDLSAAGARARFFRPRAGEKLHAKLGIFDGATVVFGSCNWSRSGFSRNHELDLLIASAAIASVFLSRLQADWAASGG